MLITVEQDANFASAHYNLANVLAGFGRTPGAIQHYNEALRLDPDNVDAHYNRGALLASQGKQNYAEARAEFERALQLRPDFLPARQGLETIRIRETRDRK